MLAPRGSFRPKPEAEKHSAPPTCDIRHRDRAPDLTLRRSSHSMTSLSKTASSSGFSIISFLIAVHEAECRCGPPWFDGEPDCRAAETISLRGADVLGGNGSGQGFSRRRRDWVSDQSRRYLPAFRRASKLSFGNTKVH